jgi:hypothetical protein
MYCAWQVTDGLGEKRPDLVKEEKKNIRDEVGQGSGKSDEAEESNKWRGSNPAKYGRKRLRISNTVKML